MSQGMHHLHLRKRLYKNLEQFPHPKTLVRWFDYAMYAIAIVAPVVLLPQVYQLFVYQSAEGLSLATWLLLGTVNLLWSFYGLVHRERLIFLSNFLIAVLDAVIVCGILLYR